MPLKFKLVCHKTQRSCWPSSQLVQFDFETIQIASIKICTVNGKTHCMTFTVCQNSIKVLNSTEFSAANSFCPARNVCVCDTVLCRTGFRTNKTAHFLQEVELFGILDNLDGMASALADSESNDALNNVHVEINGEASRENGDVRSPKRNVKVFIILSMWF